MLFSLHVLVKTEDMGQFGLSIDLLSSVIGADFRSDEVLCTVFAGFAPKLSVFPGR